MSSIPMVLRHGLLACGESSMYVLVKTQITQHKRHQLPLVHLEQKHQRTRMFWTNLLLLLLLVSGIKSYETRVKSTSIFKLISSHMNLVSPASDACLMVHVDEKMTKMSPRDLSFKENDMPTFILSMNETFKVNEDCLHLILSSNPAEALDNLTNNGQLTLRSVVIMVIDGVIISLKDFMPRLTLVMTDGQVLKMRSDATWVPIGHMNNEKLGLQKSTKLDLLGSQLEARAVVYPPWYSEKKLDNYTNLAEGIEVSLVTRVADALNASVHFATPEDGGLWGVDRNKTGNFDGLVGSLQRGEADVGFAQLFVKYERTPFMDFSREYDVDSVCFLTTISPPLPQSLALIRPFTIDVWIWVLVSMLFSLTFIGSHSKIRATISTELSTAGRKMLLLLAIIAFEPDVSFPRIRDSSLRVFLVAYSLGFVVLSRSYSSGMTSLLTVPMRNPPIDSVQGVAESGIPSASLGFSTFIQRYSTNPWIQQLRPHHITLSRRIPLKEVFTGAANNTYVLYQSEQFLSHTVRKDFSNGYGETELHIVPECLQSFNVALGLAKYSILKPSVDRVIQDYKEAGLIMRWTQIEAERYGRIVMQEKNVAALAEPFDMGNMEGPFFAGAIALAVAIAVFGLELLCGRKKKGDSPGNSDHANNNQRDHHNNPDDDDHNEAEDEGGQDNEEERKTHPTFSFLP